MKQNIIRTFQEIVTFRKSPVRNEIEVLVNRGNSHEFLTPLCETAVTQPGLPTAGLNGILKPRLEAFLVLVEKQILRQHFVGLKTLNVFHA